MKKRIPIMFLQILTLFFIYSFHSSNITAAAGNSFETENTISLSKK